MHVDVKNKEEISSKFLLTELTVMHFLMIVANNEIFAYTYYHKHFV
jgi:hypothetical protein